jgi:DNA-binding Xre family transcriptional regulator
MSTAAPTTHCSANMPDNFTRHGPVRLYRLRRHEKAVTHSHPTRGAVCLDVERVCRERGVVVERGPYRGRANLTALRRLTGLSYVTLYNLLRRPGRHQAVSLNTLTRLCEGLECEPGELFSYKPSAPIESPRESYHYGAQAFRPRGPDPERDAAEFAAAVPSAEARAVERDWQPEDDFESAS